MMSRFFIPKNATGNPISSPNGSVRPGLDSTSFQSLDFSYFLGSK